MRILVSLLFMFVGLALAEEEEGAHNITVEPPRLAIEVNSIAVFNCTTLHGGNIVWKDANDSVIVNDGRFNWTANGVLTITNTTEADSGNYKCELDDGSKQLVEALLKVYVMPTYFMEGMIILAIDGVLLLIFLGCCIKSQVQQQKSIKKMKRGMSKNIT